MKYFVKLAGKAFGPLEEDKIVEMYQVGRLKDPVEISRDKKNWESIDIILPSAPPPELPPIEPPKVDASALIPNEEVVSPKSAVPNVPVWFYSVDGSRGYGPVSKSDLGTMMQCGMIKYNSLVWRQGENSRPVSVVPELMDIIQVAVSQSSSAGLGNETSSVSSIPPLPDNLLHRGLSASTNSLTDSGMGAARPVMTDFRSNANMFDLLDDPGFGNDGLGYNRAPAPPVGQTSRSSYLLLALLLGHLGIHNFYANRMDYAIVQLFIGLSNLVGLIIISFVSLATEGQRKFLFIIPAIIWIGLEIWAIIEMCIVTTDGSGKRMY